MAAIGLLLLATGAWRGLEERAQGLALAQRGPVPWNPRVVLVSFDEDYFERVDGMFDHAEIARVVDALGSAGAAAVQFDVYINASDPRPDGDERLRTALERFGKVALLAQCVGSQAQPSRYPAGASRSSIPPGPMPAAKCAAFLLPRLMRDAKVHFGHVQKAYSPSGYVRREFLFARSGDRRWLTLPLLAWMVSRDLQPGDLEESATRLSVGELTLDTNEWGTRLMSVRPYLGIGPGSTAAELAGQNEMAFVDLADALSASGKDTFPDELAGRLKGAFVVFGRTDDLSGDYGPVADGRRVPMVMTHVATLSDLLEGRVERDSSGWLNAALFLVLGLISAWATLRVKISLAIAVPGTLLLAVPAATIEASHSGQLFPVLTLMTVTGLGGATGLFIRLRRRERERRLLRDAMGNYVDERIINRVLQDPNRHLALSGTNRTVTILFGDIQGFTHLSNSLSPQQITAMLRDYLEVMARTVIRNRGRVDKIMGDGVMAVFGDPVEDEDHALSAVQAAVQIQEGLRALRESRRSGDGPVIRARIGVATGEVVVGNIGAVGAKLEYTAIGPAVNLAARLESKAPTDGILISAATREAVGERFELRASDPLELKGFDGMQSAWLVIDDRQQSEPTKGRSGNAA